MFRLLIIALFLAGFVLPYQAVRMDLAESDSAQSSESVTQLVITPSANSVSPGDTITFTVNCVTSAAFETVIVSETISMGGQAGANSGWTEVLPSYFSITGTTNASKNYSVDFVIGLDSAYTESSYPNVAYCSGSDGVTQLGSASINVPNPPPPSRTPTPTDTPTLTATPVPPTPTKTNTPTPTATATNVPPTATMTHTPIATATSTPVPPTATKTNTPAATATATNAPPTPTKTNTPIPTATATTAPSTPTRTNTPVPTEPPTSTPTTPPPIQYVAFLPIITRGCWSNADVLNDAPNAVLDQGKIMMELNCVYAGTVNVATDIRDYYAITLQAGNPYTIRLYDWSPPASASSDLDLFLRSSVGPDYAIVGRSEGTTGVETIQYNPPTSGVYFVIPQAYSTTQTTTYHLTVTQP